MAGKVKVVQTDEQEIPVEILAESIKEIAAGVKKLRSGKLNDRAIILLISDNCNVGRPAIRKVLESMETLAATYLKK